MTALSVARLPIPPPSQPSRPFSRYSNLSESYVYPHTDIHPLTLPDSQTNNKPRFNPTTKPPPPPPQHSIFTPPTPHSPTTPYTPHSHWSGADVCLPRASTPAAVHVDPTYNAPLSAALATASLDRFPLSALSANALHRNRQAVQEDEEEGRRRKDEQARVRYARQAARRRVGEEERRRREEAERRIQQLPLHVRQLVYQKWEDTILADDTQLQETTRAAPASDEKATHYDHNNSTRHQAAAATAANTHRTMHVHDLDDTTLPNQTVATQRPNDTIAIIPHSFSNSTTGRPVMSRDEQRLFQLRVQQLARHKERLELHRVIAWRKEEAQRKRAEQQQRRHQQQQEEAALLHKQQQQPQHQQQQQHQQHNDTTHPPQRNAQRHHHHPASVPPTPRHRHPASSRRPPPMLSWLYDELERRLRAMGDVSVAPLCGCSRGGGGGGVGRGLVHVVGGGCEWVGRDEAYAMKLLERVEELERAHAAEHAMDVEAV